MSEWTMPPIPDGFLRLVAGPLENGAYPLVYEVSCEGEFVSICSLKAARTIKKLGGAGWRALAEESRRNVAALKMNAEGT